MREAGMAVTLRIPALSISRKRGAPPAPPVCRTPKVAVFTTSCPRYEDDFAGSFVADAVDRLRELGHEVEVVEPGDYRNVGFACDGRGIVGNLRRRPWLAPLLFVSMVRSLRRTVRAADLVHALGLPAALVAVFSGRPFVVALHTSTSGGYLEDSRLCERHPRLVRAVLGRAGAVICRSEALLESTRRAGVENAILLRDRSGVVPARR